MRLSSLVLAPILVISPFVLAQHRATTEGGGAPSSSSPSAPTYSGGTSSSSAPTYSGGSSTSSSSSSSSHSSSSGSSSSSSSSSASHSSASPGSSTYHGSGASSRGSTDSGRSSGRSEPAPRVHDRNVRNSDSGHSNMTGATSTRTAPSDNTRTVRDVKSGRVPGNADRQLKSEAKPEREKRNFFLFWRHPKRDPGPDRNAKVQPPKRCKQGENCATAIQEAKVQPPKRCKVGEVCPKECPPGSSLNDKGSCVTPPPAPANSCPAYEQWDAATLRCVSHSVICPGSELWDGVRCVGDPCGDVAGRGRILANELRGLKGRMQTACGQNPDGQECFQLTQSYSSTLARYRMLYDGASANCRLGLFDPASF